MATLGDQTLSSRSIDQLVPNSHVVLKTRKLRPAKPLKRARYDLRWVCHQFIGRHGSAVFLLCTVVTRTTRSASADRAARESAAGARRTLLAEDFHNAVLTAATLPIDMLEREVDTYIQSAARR
ncbi:MAG TPA: hypothetical protein VHJ58_19400 [Vicinamibacterales bacterium]|nr:hypothetical protein [Vicinamibacterales bacterium]